jgi:hypothetical protein
MVLYFLGVFDILDFLNRFFVKYALMLASSPATIIPTVSRVNADMENLRRFEVTIATVPLHGDSKVRNLNELVTVIHRAAILNGIIRPDQNVDYYVDPIDRVNTPVFNKTFQLIVDNKISDYFQCEHIPFTQKVADIVALNQDSITHCVYLESHISLPESSRTISMKLSFDSYVDVVMGAVINRTLEAESDIIPHCVDMRLCVAYASHLIIEKEFKKCSRYLHLNQDLVMQAVQKMRTSEINQLIDAEDALTQRNISRVFARIYDAITDHGSHVTVEQCRTFIEEYCTPCRLRITN